MAVIHRVVAPLQPLLAPVLHGEVSGHQLGVERQVQVKVLPVGRQAVEQPGLGGLRRRRPDDGVPGSASPSARPVVLHSVAEELSVLVHPHRHGQLVVLQVGQELLFGREEEKESGGRGGRGGDDCRVTAPLSEVSRNALPYLGSCGKVR